MGAKLALAFALLAAFIHVLNKVKSFRFPASEYLLKNFDVGTLGVLGICFASAAASGLMGLSPALGAFLGGLAVGHSTLRRGALTMAQPVQSILLFVFFLSVGLLIAPAISGAAGLGDRRRPGGGDRRQDRAELHPLDPGGQEIRHRLRRLAVPVAGRGIFLRHRRRRAGGQERSAQPGTSSPSR